MVRGASRIVQFRLNSANRPLCQDPIDTAGTAEVRSSGRRSSLAVMERIMELHAANERRGWSLSEIEIEVTCHYDWELRNVLASIIEELSKLTTTKAVVASTFEVQVVQNYRSVVDCGMAHAAS